MFSHPTLRPPAPRNAQPVAYGSLACLMIATVATSKQVTNRTPNMKTSLGLHTVIVVLLVLACTAVLVTPELIGGAAAKSVPALMARTVLAHH
jgi:hypothetical protein